MSAAARLDVILVGPVPPPRGGVASHVDRLALLLEEEGFRVGILNHFSQDRDRRVIAGLRRNPARYWFRLRGTQGSVIHYHHSRLDTLLATALARRNSESRWIVTFHSDVIQRSLTSRVSGIALLSRWAMRRFDRIIVVSDALGEIVRAQTGRPVTVIPAYLPLRHRVTDNRDVGPVTPTAIVAASRVASRASSDRYGLNVASAIFAAASTKMADLRLEIFLNQAPTGPLARRYLAKVLDPLRGAGLNNRVRVSFGSELSPALRRGAVYLRPSRTDGDAVSVREALDAGIPVLASDVVKRPAGAIALPLDDVSAWVDALPQAVERSRSLPLTANRSNEQADAMMLLYREEIGRLSGRYTSVHEHRQDLSRPGPDCH